MPDDKTADVKTNTLPKYMYEKQKSNDATTKYAPDTTKSSVENTTQAKSAVDEANTTIDHSDKIEDSADKTSTLTKPVETTDSATEVKEPMAETKSENQMTISPAEIKTEEHPIADDVKSTKAEVPASIAASLNTTTTTQIISPQVTRSASIVAELLANYKKILSQTIVTTKQHEDAAKLLGTVVTQLYASPATLVFDEVWSFFSDTTNKNTFLRESAALGGADALDLSLRSRVELVYTLFRKAVQGVDVSTYNQDTLNNLVRLPQLVNYLTNKIKIRL